MYKLFFIFLTCFICFLPATTPEIIGTKNNRPISQDGYLGLELKKTSSGDVYISGIPMIDQGNRSVCGQAVYTRLSCVYGKTVSIDDIIKIVGMKPTIYKAYTTLQKDGTIPIDFSIDLKSYKTPYTSVETFGDFIKKCIDRGIPIMWSVTIGVNPEVPHYSGPKTRHGRIIIGYNSKKGEVLYTDTWGKGHELKRWTFQQGFAVTLSVIPMPQKQSDQDKKTLLKESSKKFLTEAKNLLRYRKYSEAIDLFKKAAAAEVDGAQKELDQLRSMIDQYTGKAAALLEKEDYIQSYKLYKKIVDAYGVHAVDANKQFKKFTEDKSLNSELLASDLLLKADYYFKKKDKANFTKCTEALLKNYPETKAAVKAKTQYKL